MYPFRRYHVTVVFILNIITSWLHVYSVLSHVRSHLHFRRSVFAQRCSPTVRPVTRNGSPRSPGKCSGEGDALRPRECPTRCHLSYECPARCRLFHDCPTFVLRCNLAQELGLRVAALSQTWFARVAPRAVLARRCLADQMCIPSLHCHMLALCLFRRGVFAQRCFPTDWADTRNGSPRNLGKCFGEGCVFAP